MKTSNLARTTSSWRHGTGLTPQPPLLNKAHAHMSRRHLDDCPHHEMTHQQRDHRISLTNKCLTAEATRLTIASTPPVSSPALLADAAAEDEDADDTPRWVLTRAAVTAPRGWLSLVESGAPPGKSRDESDQGRERERDQEREREGVHGRNVWHRLDGNTAIALMTMTHSEASLCPDAVGSVEKTDRSTSAPA